MPSLLALFLLPALASPPSIARGDDVVAWRSLLSETPCSAAEESVAAYRAFVVDYTESPLAEAAWDCLVDHDALDPRWDTNLKLQPLAARYEAHQASLARVAVAVAPGVLTPEGAPMVIVRNPAPIAVGGPDAADPERRRKRRPPR